MFSVPCGERLLSSSIEERTKVRSRKNEIPSFEPTLEEEIPHLHLSLLERERRNHPATDTKLHDRARVYATGVGKPSALGPAFSFKASVNSCKLETICGALVKTAEASFSA